MGTDIYPIMKINGATPERQQEILEQLDEEHGICFEDAENGTFTTEGVRWNGMEDDMRAFSAKYPGVQFHIRYQWDDESEYSLWASNGKSYEDHRPEWTPPPFDEAKLK